MEYLDLAKKRYSVRKYSNRKVDAESLNKILEAAHVAPTAANRQPVHLIVVQNEEALSRLGKAANIFGAPLAIIACADKEKSWVRPVDGMQTLDIDATIVTDHMMLEATDLGLGSVWICMFKPDVVKEEFNLPENLVPVNILAIGYANDEPASPDRHSETRVPLEQIVSYDTMP